MTLHYKFTSRPYMELKDKSIIIEPTQNSVEVSLIKAETLMSILSPFQILTEKREVAGKTIAAPVTPPSDNDDIDGGNFTDPDSFTLDGGTF